MLSQRDSFWQFVPITNQCLRQLEPVNIPRWFQNKWCSFSKCLASKTSNLYFANFCLTTWLENLKQYTCMFKGGAGQKKSDWTPDVYCMHLALFCCYLRLNIMDWNLKANEQNNSSHTDPRVYSFLFSLQSEGQVFFFPQQRAPFFFE